MTAQVTARAVRGRFVRHAPHDSDPLHRPEPPPDGRWQRGELVGGLYLADEPATAWAEWYRHLAERGLPPEHAIPHDLHVWAVDVELADLSNGARLAAIGLPSPRPGRQTWASYQRVGEQLWRDGWAGVCAPSAARPEHMVICLFAGPWPPAGANPLPRATISVTAAPPPPRGMRTWRRLAEDRPRGKAPVALCDRVPVGRLRPGPAPAASLRSTRPCPTSSSPARTSAACHELVALDRGGRLDELLNR